MVSRGKSSNSKKIKGNKTEKVRCSDTKWMVYLLLCAFVPDSSLDLRKLSMVTLEGGPRKGKCSSGPKGPG